MDYKVCRVKLSELISSVSALRVVSKFHKNRRGNSKSKQHRRRNVLSFPYLEEEFRREAILRRLGPWIRSEYKKASNALMLRKRKPEKAARQARHFFVNAKSQRSVFIARMWLMLHRDCLSLCVILFGAGCSLTSYELIFSTAVKLRTDLVALMNQSEIWYSYWIQHIGTYFKCVDMRRPPTRSPDLRPLQRKSHGFDIKGYGITFQYPQSIDHGQNKPAKRALDNLDFHFEAGKTHALVGDNGSGKTTLVQLISQLYNLYSGQLSLNGYDIKQYDVDEVRSHMSVMFQEVAKLRGFSVSENIGIGEVAAMDNLALVTEMARQHHITDFISVDTVIGDLSQTDRDADEKWQGNLSGGQWQRIALARTFMRAKDADLIILDEPTSALDVDAEYQFFQQLKKSRRGKTTIFITHKYVTTATADCIHFMQGGRIVERGTHAELMSGKGEYARRYILQTRGFAEN